MIKELKKDFLKKLEKQKKKILARIEEEFKKIARNYEKEDAILKKELVGLTDLLMLEMKVPLTKKEDEL